jgi:uncharacterized protein
MQTCVHPLVAAASGTQRQLTSLHYGRAGGGPKVYLQASLHADELPGMLALHHLRRLLDAAEARGEVVGEVVLVPMANPIGLDQTLLHQQIGRFEHASMENFNRNYPDFFALLKDGIAAQLGPDERTNRDAIRLAMRTALAALPAHTELQSLRKLLTGLALDADVVLDLHCDREAVVHLYVDEPLLPQADALSRCLGAQVLLWARGSGGSSFDEALSGPWWRLAEHLGGRFPIAPACFSATVELRGQRDVSHALAEADARRLWHYLLHLGVVRPPSGATLPPLPAALCEPTPLAGAQLLQAPHPGVLVYLRELGAQLQPGDVVAQVVEPLSGRSTDVVAEVAGCFYAGHTARWATAGMEIGRIAGREPLRSGMLLGP